MAKVGIVTFHSAHNFGAVLQCLALKTVISDLGHDVTVIDHRNPEIEQCYAVKQMISKSFGDILQIKQKIANFLTYFRRISRFNKYQNFINKYILSKESDRPLEKYDSIVWGSDQIWRWDIIKDDLFYWGKCGSERTHKITYAASAGKIDEHFDKNIRYLKEFNAISVREPDLKDYLFAKGISSEISLDPTLLLSQKEWERILPIQKSDTDPYILVYSMRNRKKVKDLALKISEKEGLKIIEIFSSFISPRYILKKHSDGGPIDFISLIHGAKYVITDSFHGTAFSIIFNRQFITVRLNDGLDNRSEGLLNSLGIPDRMKLGIDGYNIPIDYTKVNGKLTEIKSSSISYLKKNITPT